MNLQYFYILIFFAFSANAQNNPTNYKPAWHWDCLYAADLIVVVDTHKSIYAAPLVPIGEIKSEDNKLKKYFYASNIKIEKVLYYSPKLLAANEIYSHNNKINFSVISALNCIKIEEKMVDYKTFAYNNSVYPLFKISDKESKKIVFISYTPLLGVFNGIDLLIKNSLPYSNIVEVNATILDRIKLETNWKDGQ